MTHPLRLWLQAQPSTIWAACESLAAEVTARGTPVSPHTIRSISDGVRRPRTPLSTTIASVAGIDELELIKWGRPEVPAPRARRRKRVA